MSDNSKEDILNVEHLGDWDHGVEPDALDASFSNTDEDPTGRFKGHEPEIFSETKRIVKQAKTAVVKLIHDLSDKASHVTDDPELKDQVANHTEEEVAGMKLCVSDKVRPESFDAPC